jgi:hypothetical protein
MGQSPYAPFEEGHAALSSEKVAICQRIEIPDLTCESRLRDGKPNWHLNSLNSLNRRSQMASLDRFNFG